MGKIAKGLNQTKLKNTEVIEFLYKIAEESDFSI